MSCRLAPANGNGLWPGFPAGGGAFNPLSLSPSLWIDASDTSTLFQDSAGTVPVTAAADPIGKVNDKSTLGKHFTQATAAARPAFRITSGKNSINFDGVDDGLASVAGLTWDASNDIFIVLNNTANDTSFVTMWDASSTPEFLGVVVLGDAGATYDGFIEVASLVNGSTYAPNTRGGLYTAIGTTANKILETQATTLAFWQLGLGNYPGFVANIHIHEILIYPALSAPNRTTVRNYLTAKWGVA